MCWRGACWCFFMQYDLRVQHWLVSSMLTVTLMEEQQLMQRSYELCPRKIAAPR
jgi:hypothetical protein